MVPERPASPHRLASSSPSRPKRPLSSPVSSAAKRANSEDLMDQSQLSDTEGSLGASRLKISSTPATPSSDHEGSEPSPPPAYDDATRAFSGPPGETQLEIVKELKEGTLDEGDAWFLVSRVWYRRWVTACSGAAASKDDDTSLSVDQVGPIDNSDLAVDDGQLKKPVSEGVDLELLPAPAYNLLKEWYGSMGPDYERSVVATAGPGSERVEYYPPTFQIFLLCPTDGGTSSPVSIPTFDSAPTVSLSAASPFSALHRFASEAFSLGRPTRLWRLPEAGDAVSASEGPAFVLSDKLLETGVELLELPDDTSLEDGLLSDAETRIAVEQQKPDGTWQVDAEAILASLQAGATAPSTRAVTPSADPATAPPAMTTNTAEKKASKGLFGNGWSSTLHKPKSNGNLAGSVALSGTNANAKASGSGSGSLISTLTGALTRSKTGPAKAGQRGLVGLSNLGNTCFMNSAIQCMSNTKELKDYFLSGAYKDELNPDNPLGMRGQVAEAFGQLIERMWHGSGSSVAPREFKQAVARFAPQFSGYGQQDSQELLAFLLDGTHEDLNRILKKPGTSAPDWEGGGDKELVEMAKTCWEQYRSRNDSVIVDLFQGQYRSTVVCPDCDKVSITFDPFMYVTTNLPVTKKWDGTVFVVPRDRSRKVISLDVEVPKNGTVKTLKNCVGKVLDMDPRNLLITEEWHGKFWKQWPDDDPVSDIHPKNDKIILYETAATISQPRFRKKQAVEAQQDPNAPITLVVLHRKAAVKSSRMTFGVNGSSENFGSPFVLSLTPEEASTVEGIKKVLIDQYARTTLHADELVEFFERDLKASVTTTKDDAGPLAPVAIEPESTDPVAPSDPAESAMDVDGASTDPSLESATTSSLPAPPVPSTATAPAPVSAMFTVQVSSRTRRGANSLPLEQNAFNAELEPLDARVASVDAATTRLAANEDYDMFSASSEPASEVDESGADNATAPAGAAPRPLIRTGDYLVVGWEASAYEYFHGAAASKWEEVEPVVDPALAARRSLGKQKQTITLDQCLTEFTKEERLGEEDMWYCSACKDFKQATKKVEIWKAPDVLVFALKRFSSGRYSRDKIDDFVDFPLEGFDMEPFVEGDKVEARLAAELGPGVAAPAISGPDSLLYDLYAVSNHFGGLGGGHYTAFAKNPDNNKWYDFDDSRVSPLSDPTRAVSSSAYLLFYRRRTARPIGGAKSISAVESAIQSRQASAAPSGYPSPFASTDNLALPAAAAEGPNSTASSIMPGTFDDNDHHADADADADEPDERSSGFTGMFAPRTLTSNRRYDNNDDDDDDDDAAGSIASNEPASPKSEPVEGWDASPPPRSPAPHTKTNDDDGPVREIKLDGAGGFLSDVE
ncbi:hypothetical protein JCM11491_006140 [Sporobolomyces phaffii]